jgi:FkbM family methyltransferase
MAAGVLSGASLLISPEGGLHHAAAALGVRAVVIFGGFISPATTGYALHTNLFTAARPAGCASAACIARGDGRHLAGDGRRRRARAARQDFRGGSCMTSVWGYPQPKKTKSYEIVRAFCQGAGGRVSPQVVHLNPGAAAFYGAVGIEPLFEAARARGAWYYLDNAFLDQARGTHFRVGVDRLQGPLLPADRERLKPLGVEVKPWRSSGSHVLLCPQSDYFMRTIARWEGGVGNWVHSVIKQLEIRTDREIRVRPWSADKMKLAGTLAEDLVDCWAVVSHSSAAAIGALLAGVPVFLTGGTPLEHFANTGSRRYRVAAHGRRLARGLRGAAGGVAMDDGRNARRPRLARPAISRGGNAMIQCGGVWLPDGETHLVDWMKKVNQVVEGKLTYQYAKLEAALGYVRQFRCAVDVGAHCGLWSMHLAKRFQLVHAFEPVKAHRECFEANLRGAPQTWILHPMALGDREGSVEIHTAPTSSGDSWVKGAGEIPLKRLDDLLLEALPVDFMKLDCEGYELLALRGAEAILKRCRPAIIVEQKPGRAQKFGLPETGAVDYLESLGAKLRRIMSGDYLLSWD